jgi:hypothetical protein
MRLRSGLLALGLVSVGAPAMADTVKYAAELAGDDLNAPQASAAKGKAAFTFDTASKTLTWTVEYSGLSQAATGWSCGTIDSKTGPVVSVKSGLASPIKGSKTIGEADASALSARRWVCVLETSDDNVEIGGEVAPAR